LSYELWDNVFDNSHHNYAAILFNSFLNTYVQVFYSCFPNINFDDRPNKKSWVTDGRRISCKRTRDLYLLTKNNNATKLKKYYKLYCKILTNAIKEAQRTNYNEQIVNSHNKVNTTWNIKKSATREKVNVDDISLLSNVGDKINNMMKFQ